MLLLNSDVPNKNLGEIVIPNRSKMVGAILHIGENKSYQLFKLEGFPRIQIGKQLLVESESLKSFLQKYEGTQIHLS